MPDLLFHIFPNENFIDLCMYQFGYVIQDILLDRLPAITICFIIFLLEQELCWQMIRKE